MSFHQFIQYKTLDRIYSTNGEGLLEMALRDPSKSDAIKQSMKNVCALISLELFQNLDSVCDLLSMSKREFIEYAIIEALEKTKKIMEENDFYENFLFDVKENQT